MPVATPIPRGVGIYWLLAVAAPPMPVATPIPWGVGIYWLRNHGRCVIARHHWSCVDRSWHHVDWRCCINRDCIDRRRRVRRWGRRCVPIGRCRQISDRFCDRSPESYKLGPMRWPLKMPKRLRRERELYSSPISLVVLCAVRTLRPYIKRGLRELVRGGAQYIRWEFKRSGPLAAMRGFSQFRRDRGFLSRATSLAA